MEKNETSNLQNWVIQHEMDDEPTFIVPADNQDGDYITLSPNIPIEWRLVMAKEIAAMLNQGTIRNA